MVAEGKFRQDLFYRLNVIPFQIPPLRERLEDVPLLVEHFNQKFSRDYGKKPKTFTEDAIAALQKHLWFGNVRELKNTVERVLIFKSVPICHHPASPPVRHDALVMINRLAGRSAAPSGERVSV